MAWQGADAKDYGIAFFSALDAGDVRVFPGDVQAIDGISVVCLVSRRCVFDTVDPGRYDRAGRHDAAVDLDRAVMDGRGYGQRWRGG